MRLYVPAFAVLTRAVLAPIAARRAVALPAAAAAQGGTGGAQPQASPTPTPTPAPRSAPALPPVRSKITLTRLACASGCGAGGAVRPGALLRVRGTGMRRTAEVHFDGAAGEADDVAAAPGQAPQDLRRRARAARRRHRRRHRARPRRRAHQARAARR